jgi:hypothetical protein
MSSETIEKIQPLCDVYCVIRLKLNMYKSQNGIGAWRLVKELEETVKDHERNIMDIIYNDTCAKVEE